MNIFYALVKNDSNMLDSWNDSCMFLKKAIGIIGEIWAVFCLLIDEDLKILH